MQCRSVAGAKKAHFSVMLCREALSKSANEHIPKKKV